MRWPGRAAERPDADDIADVDGAIGRIDLTSRHAGRLRIKTPRGDVLQVPPELVEEDRRGRIHLRARFDELERTGARPELAARVERTTLPLAEERVRVERRRRPIGGARVHIGVVEHPEVVEGDADVDDVEIVRVPIDRDVDGYQAERVEGDVQIIPVHEEVLRVTRQLRVVEEIHIRRTRRREHRRQEVVLRREEARVEPIGRRGR